MSNRTKTFEAIYAARKRNLLNQTLKGNKLGFFSSGDIALSRSGGLDTILATTASKAGLAPQLTTWIQFNAQTNYIPPGPMVSDGAGNFFIGNVYSAGTQGRITKVNSSGTQIALYQTPAGAVSDFAGGGWPWGLTYDGSFLYASDMRKHFIYRLDPTSSPLAWTIVAGTSGSPGDVTGVPSLSRLRGPMTLLYSGGVVFICQADNNKISRLLAPSSTVSGSYGIGVAGYVDGNNTVAKFNNPNGMFFDNSGNIILVDTGNNRIRKIKITSPIAITTVAGTGVAGSQDGPVDSATFNMPASGCCDANGNFYIADNGNLIRKISNGVVTTIFSPANTPKLTAQSGIINLFYYGGYVYVSEVQSFNTYRFAV